MTGSPASDATPGPIPARVESVLVTAKAVASSNRPSATTVMDV